MSKVVTFGEVMMRLSPPGYLRFEQAQSFDLVYGGSEANVAVSLSNYGVETDFVTRLPENDLGDACLAFLRKHGVGVDNIVRGGSRLGIYFLEMGAVQRGSNVIYDRAHSAIATIDPDSLAWDRIFSGADWFHWTGITPAISEGLAEATLRAVKAAQENGVTVSCDLNYRSKLWKWGKEASDVMPELAQYVDVVIANEEDADKVFGIKAPETDVTSGVVESESYRFVCKEMAKQFPNLKTIAITLRGSLSASHNTWSAIMWDDGEFYEGPEYDITHIVDRVGGGDSFGGGLIYGLRAYEDKQDALNFAVAASCLKHTIFGDFNLVTVEEVLELAGGDVSGRVSR
jgi:2-dehydro-3-deoxygluconokinase